MPLPKLSRANEYAIKAVELGLRTAGEAPEQRAAKRLARGVEGRGDGPRVLFVTPRDWAAHVQYEAVIAHALRLRGADVRFLGCGGGLEICDRANTHEAPPMPCGTCDRYVRTSIEAHGFPRTSMRSQWEAEAADPGVWPELDSMGRSELDQVAVEDIDLGALVDKPVRWFLLAANVEDDPLGTRVRRRFLRSGRRILRSVAATLDEQEPDVVVVLNGLFLFESITWALCRARGIDVVTYERAFRKETLVFSRRAPAGFYDFSEAWADSHRDLTPVEGTEIDEYLALRRSGQAFDQHWGPGDAPDVGSGPGRLVTLFTNVTWDTAVLGRHCAFPDIQAWIDAAIDAFRRRPEHRLVIRVHPSEMHLPGRTSRDSLAAHIARTHPELPPNVRVIGPDDPVSSYPLMAASDLGLVYTSTVGLELAVSGVPTIVAGDTHYRGKGFTTDVESPDGFIAALDTALADPSALAPDTATARRYAHFFFFRAPLPAPGVVEPLPGLARLTVRDLSELEPGRSESLDRICDGILLGAPFVTGTG
jgi:Capsule polysaccharide biosynthesis protein